MDDLDKILETIIEGGQYISAKEFLITFTEHTESPRPTMQQRIESAKRALTDAGYSKSPLAGIKTKMEISGMMSGQEWYNRYIAEKGFGSLDNLKDMPSSKDYSDGIDHAVIKCDEAAARAAGLMDSL